MYLTTRAPVAALGGVVFAILVPAPRWTVLFVVNATLAIVVLIELRSAPAAADLQIRQSIPAVVSMDRATSASVEVHNPLQRPLQVEMTLAAPASLGRDPARHRITLAPGAWGALALKLSPSRRGITHLGPATIRTLGRRGLAGRQQTLPGIATLKVYPALPGRKQVALRLERARLLQSGQRSSAVRGGGTNFDSLREYHPDDEFRRINWKATARSSKPISNLFREERNQQVVLMLDAGRTMATSIEGITRFEYAIDASVAVAELAARVGDHVGMVAFGRDVIAMVGPKGGKGQPRVILDRLFYLEPALDAPNYGRAFAALLARYRRRALLMLLTELNDEAAMDSLFTAVPSLVARHLVVTGSVVDPEVERLAAAIPRSSEEVYLKASASASLMARDRVGSRLRAMGVAVVDANAGDLAGRLVDQYLRIKAFGRL